MQHFWISEIRVVVLEEQPVALRQQAFNNWPILKVPKGKRLTWSMCGDMSKCLHREGN